MYSPFHGRKANQAWAVARRSAGILLLLLIANLLAACGSGGGGDVSATTDSTTTSGVPAAGASATLTWDAVIAQGISGYRVYYGTAPGTYEQLAGQGVDVGNSTTYTSTGLGSGTIYYFAVTAYNNLNQESGYSNEVSKQMP